MTGVDLVVCLDTDEDGETVEEQPPPGRAMILRLGRSEAYRIIAPADPDAPPTYSETDSFDERDPNESEGPVLPGSTRWSGKTKRERNRFSALVARIVRAEHAILLARSEANVLMIQSKVHKVMKDMNVRSADIGRLSTVAIELVFTPNEVDIEMERFRATDVYHRRMDAVNRRYWSLSFGGIWRYFFGTRVPARG